MGREKLILSCLPDILQRRQKRRKQVRHVRILRPMDLFIQVTNFPTLRVYKYPEFIMGVITPGQKW